MRTSTDIAVIAVGSDLAAEVVPRVCGAIDAVVERGCRRVVLNMDGAERIDRSGIGLIVTATRALRQRDGLLSLVNVHERAYRTLRNVRIVDFVPISVAGPRPRVSELPPTAQPLWRTVLSVDTRRFDEVRRRLGELFGRLALSTDEIFDLTLAVGEAVGNAIDHAEGAVIVAVAAYVDRVVVEVTDGGRGFELADDEDPAVDETDERGRGIALMRMLVDSVSIGRRPSGTGTCTRIVKLTQS